MLKSDFREKIFSSLAVSLLLSFTLFFFIPMQLYMTNSIEFDFIFPDLLFFLLLIAGATSILLCILLVFIAARFCLKQRMENFVFAVGFLLWLQSNILVWRYGPLDGRQIPWGDKMVLGLIDGAIWLAVLVLAQVKINFFSRIAKRTAWALLLLQLFFALFYYFSSPPFPDSSNFNFSKKGQFDFSRQKNVILLVIDCFQSDLFQEIIDEECSLKETFAGFTYFRNTLGGFPTTYASVPLILTGKYYDNSQPIQHFIKNSYLSSSSLPLVLNQHGVQVALFPTVRKVVYSNPSMAMNIIKRPYPFLWSEFGSLMDISLFRALPHFGKRLVFNDQKWFMKNLVPKKPFNWFKAKSPKVPGLKEPTGQKSAGTAKLLRKKQKKSNLNISRGYLPKGSLMIPDVNFMHQAIVSSTAGTVPTAFKYYHLLGIHAPFRMNENLEPEPLRHTRANCKRLVRGELKLVKIFFMLLKNLKIFDDALIIVMGDHGHPLGKLGRVLPPEFRELKTFSNNIPVGVVEAATPLFLAKRFHSSGEMKISDAPVSVADIAKTIFVELRIATDCPGESIFNVPESAARARLFYYYTWSRNDWESEYLPPLIEYRVNGHSWLDKSWQATGRILRKH